MRFHSNFLTTTIRTNEGQPQENYNQMSQTVSRRTRRRSLHTIELNPPDYKVPSSVNLVDDYIEKEVEYVASIPNVSFSIDPTRRTDILSVLDKSRQHMTDRPNGNQDAIFSFSAREIKLIRRDTESVIVREVIHNIAAVSYIQDSSRHFIFVKTADGESPKQVIEYCKLIVCLCPSKDKAEEICSIIQQIFDIVYTELTMKGLDESIRDLMIQPAPASIEPARYSIESVRGDGNSLMALLQEYMEMIKQKLTQRELQEFGRILRTYKTNNDVRVFCRDLHRLYGEERKTLINGMRPFIPDGGIGYFDDFLESKGIPKPVIFLPASRRTPSETSTIIPAYIGPYSHSEIGGSR